MVVPGSAFCLLPPTASSHTTSPHSLGPLLLPQMSDETYFKVKKTTSMKKVFAAYASRRYVPPIAVVGRVLFCRCVHLVCVCACVCVCVCLCPFPFVLTLMMCSLLLFLEFSGVQVEQLRFLLDGERVNPDDTPASLELEDQDQLDCLLEQTGGRN